MLGKCFSSFLWECGEPETNFSPPEAREEFERNDQVFTIEKENVFHPEENAFSFSPHTQFSFRQRTSCCAEENIGGKKLKDIALWRTL
jgi:hypothetical protein